MTKLAELFEHYDQIVESQRQLAVGSLPSVVRRIRVKNALVDWIGIAAEKSGHAKMDLFNKAVGFAAFRQLAGVHRLRIYGEQPSRALTVIRELPEVPPYTPDVRSTQLRLPLTHTSNQLLAWMDEERGMLPGAVMWEGVHTLAGLALMGRGYRLFIEGSDSRDVAGLEQLNLAGVPKIKLD